MGRPQLGFPRLRVVAGGSTGIAMGLDDTPPSSILQCGFPQGGVRFAARRDLVVCSRRFHGRVLQRATGPAERRASLSTRADSAGEAGCLGGTPAQGAGRGAFPRCSYVSLINSHAGSRAVKRGNLSWTSRGPRAISTLTPCPFPLLGAFYCGETIACVGEDNRTL
jgi:hypothetical protein